MSASPALCNGCTLCVPLGARSGARHNPASHRVSSRIFLSISFRVTVAQAVGAQVAATIEMMTTTISTRIRTRCVMAEGRLVAVRQAHLEMSEAKEVVTAVVARDRAHLLHNMARVLHLTLHHRCLQNCHHIQTGAM